MDRESLLEGIGETFVVDNPGVSFKLLPCCGSIHSSVWAVIGLYEEGGYQPSEIASIRAFVDPKRIAHTSRIDVTNGLEAKFSSQYCQAVAALTGQLTLADFDDDAVTRPERQDLLRRVSVLPAIDVAEWANPDDSHTGSRGGLGRDEVVRATWCASSIWCHVATRPILLSDGVLLAKVRRLRESRWPSARAGERTRHRGDGARECRGRWRDCLDGMEERVEVSWL